MVVVVVVVVVIAVAGPPYIIILRSSYDDTHLDGCISMYEYYAYSSTSAAMLNYA